MKVFFNLALEPDPRDRYALKWAVPVLVVALLGLGWLAVSAFSGLRRLHQVQRSLAQVRTSEAALRSKEVRLQQEINRPEYKALIEKTEFVNQLIGQRQFSLTELTFKVSKLLPPNARLSGLALASSSEAHPEVQFAVMGKDEEAIETFLDHLERSGDFNDVIIKSQGFRGGSGGEPQEVALVCTARYVAEIPPRGN
jgi:hypothetical protein